MLFLDFKDWFNIFTCTQVGSIYFQGYVWCYFHNWLMYYVSKPHKILLDCSTISTANFIKRPDNLLKIINIL